MTYLLALDQGPSSSRSLVFDAQGHIKAQAQQALTQIYPQPGWVEHEPQEFGAPSSLLPAKHWPGQASRPGRCAP